MKPRWHILFGAIFTLILWLFVPEIKWLYLLLVFLSSFLIDFDHYIQAVRKNGHLSLGKAFEYHNELERKQEKELKKGIKKKSDFHFFHTIEFHILIGLLGLFWIGFFYVFIGMVFHSLIDVLDGLRKGWIYKREFFLINKIKK